MKYLLDISKLRIGDIILESGDTKIISAAIKAATKSDFSHAMLYRDHSLVHAVNEGVFSKNPQRILVSNPEDLKVLRLKNNQNLSVMRKVCDNAGVKIGSLYSKSEAIKTLAVEENKPAKNRKQFCSRLVAQCYEEAGISLVSNSDYCSPEDLNQSDLLFEVKGAVREATEKDIEFFNKKDPNLENQKETFQWLRKTREIFKPKKVDVQTINDVLQALVNHRDMDKKVCRLIKATKYLELYNVDRELNAYRYDEELFKIKLAEDPEKANELIDFEIKLNQREIERHSRNLMASRENYKAQGLNFSKLHMKLHRNILKESKKRLEVIILSLSNESVQKNIAAFELKNVSEVLK